MSAAVARQKRDVAAAQRAQNIIVGGAAERRRDVGLLLCFKSGHVIQTAAPDDSDFSFQRALS